MSDVLKYVSNTNTLEQPRDGDCGYDLKSALDYAIESNCQAVVETDLCVEIPKGHWGNIRDRSSIALQQVYTHGGVLDSSYRGRVRVLVENRGNTPVIIKKGNKIAQLIICPYVSLPVTKVDSLDETERGENGFGSTGQ